MTDSRRLAGLLGPILIALTVTEWMNLGVFTEAMGPSYGPHVYLNGTLLFVAGLAIVRAHNLWTRSWPVLITLVGWFAVFAGLGEWPHRWVLKRPERAQCFFTHPWLFCSR
jgi:hypothetical protein